MEGRMAQTENGGGPALGMVELAPGVYAYQQPHGWGHSNAGLIVGEDGAVLVDTQFTMDLNRKLIAAIGEVTARPVRYIINTHHHGDHAFGDHLFPGATVVAHELCRRQMAKRGQPDPRLLASQFAMLGYDFTGMRFTLPDITFSDNMIIHQGNREIRLMYLGVAHSPADIAVHLPAEGVVYAGDFMFLGAAPLGIEASFSTWIRALDTLAGLSARYYVPGHGPVSGRDGVLEAKGYLEFVYEEARRRFDAGMDARRAALDIDLKEYRAWACWERLLVNVERLYREFRGEEPTSPLPLNELMAEMDRLAPRR